MLDNILAQKVKVETWNDDPRDKEVEHLRSKVQHLQRSLNSLATNYANLFEEHAVNKHQAHNQINKFYNTIEQQHQLHMKMAQQTQQAFSFAKQHMVQPCQPSKSNTLSNTLPNTLRNDISDNAGRQREAAAQVSVEQDLNAIDFTVRFIKDHGSVPTWNDIKDARK